MKRSADKLTAWFNLRTLVAAIGLFLGLSPSNPSFLAWLDNYVFQLGVELQNSPRPTLGVSIVELPPEEIDYLIKDPGRAEKTFRLLSRITGSDKITVGLALPGALGEYSSAERLLGELIWEGEGLSGPLPNDQRSTLEGYLTVSRGLRQFESHPRVQMLVPSSNPRASPIKTEPSVGSDYASWLLPWLRPVVPPSSHGMGEKMTLLRRSGGDLRASFLLDLYANFSRAEDIVWHEYTDLRLGGSRFPLSADGSFMPYPHPLASQRYSLDEALEDRLANNLILLGAAGAPELYVLANALRSLDGHSYYRTPFWFAGAEIALLLLAVLYLVMVLPRLSYTAGMLATSLLTVVLIVAQLGWQITQWQWLPLGVLIQLLVLGQLLIILWKRQQDQSMQLEAAAHGARYQLGLQLFRDGRGDDALLAVKECFTTEAVLGLMYDLASQQERKRHYGEAVKTYMAIVARQKNFRDAAEKVEKLMAFSSGGASTLGNSSDIARTLIISEASIRKPVLGRYEIERELGRGAMGVVYLGRDPKIAREVAIKTLSYGQLNPGELNEFKQRFFREAEAAGRLNHPNIVTIYDVGEEHDLAFIAMDFVKGSALSAYLEEDSLLPVADVLELVAEVADALEYAHGNQIIHRDIKPANIMYQPESRRVKVTDFGVARIVDGSRTSTGNILGSPLYMSPEQLKGGTVDRRTDVYSLGVSLYQLVTGKLPFDGDNLANLSYNIIHERHRPIRDLRPDLPQGLTRIINRALHKEADKRYPSAAAMAEALRRLLGEL